MNSKIFEIVKYAYENVPFYMRIKEQQNIDLDNLNSKTWEKIPLVEKDMLLKSGSVISNKYIVDLISNKLIELKTSGSTGKCLDLYWDKKDMSKSLLPLWVYRKKYHNIMTKDKLCFFYTLKSISKDEDEEFKSETKWGFSKNGLNDNKLLEIYNKMLEFEPKWLLLQPSIAVLLIRCKNKFNLPKIESIKYIELSGEILFDDVRKEIEDNFECGI